MAVRHEFLIAPVCLDRHLMDLHAGVGNHGIRRCHGRGRLSRRGHRSSRGLGKGDRRAVRRWRENGGAGRRSRRGRVAGIGSLRVRGRDARGTVAGRVGSIVIEAGDHDLERLRLGGCVRDAIPLRERRKVELDAGRGEPPEPTPECAQARRVLVVERDRQVEAVTEAAIHELREDSTGADLHEMRHARRVHGLDHLAEAHGRGELVGQTALGRGPVVGVHVRRGVREHVDSAGTPGDGAQIVVEGLTGVRHDGRMKRGRDREPHAREAPRVERGRDGFDGLDRAGEHDLRGCVVVCHDDTRILADDAGHRGRVREDRDHGALAAGGCLGHQLPAATRRGEERRLRDAAGRGQRGYLAEAVPRDRVGRESELPQQMQVPQAHRRDGGLGRLHFRDLLLLDGALLVGEGRRGEDRAIQPVTREHVHVGGAVPHGAHLVEDHRRGTAHADVLTSLTGEEKRQLSTLHGAEAERDVRIDQGFGVAGVERLQRLADLRGELVERTGDQGHASRGPGLEGGRALQRQARERLAGLDLDEKAAELAAELVVRTAREHDELLGPHAEPLGSVPAPRVLLDRHVEVRATEAERTDRAAAGVVAPPNPGTRFGIDVERAVVESELRVRPGHLERGRQHLVVQRQRELDQPGGTGRRLRVADL